MVVSSVIRILSHLVSEICKREFLFYFLSCLLKLFLAVVPAHTYAAFLTPTAGITIFFIWLLNLVIFGLVLSLHTFGDLGLQTAEIFQSTCGEVSSFETHDRHHHQSKTHHAQMMPFLSSALLSCDKGWRQWQCQVVPQHHGRLCVLHVQV